MRAFGLVLVLGCVTVAGVDAQQAPQAAAPASSGRSLASIFQAPRVSVDPDVAQLRALYDQLVVLAFAESAMASLQLAAAGTNEVASLLAQHADAELSTRKKQIVWSALSLADRLIARFAARQAYARESARAGALAGAAPPQSPMGDETATRDAAQTLAWSWQHAPILRVRSRALDFLERAERARVEAEQGGAAKAGNDRRLRARLLLTAAVVEADRIELERALAALSVRQNDAQAQLAAATRARQAEAVSAAQAQASEQATAEATQAFTLAIQGAELGRADANARASARAFFVTRAQLLLAAATLLAGDPQLTAAAQRALNAADAHVLADAAGLSLAQAALVASFRALGVARAQRAVASTEVDDLLARVHELGLSAEASARGIEVAGSGWLAGKAAALSPAAQRQLDWLASLLTAFPLSNVVIDLHAPLPAGAALTSLRARATAVRARLTRVLATTRVRAPRLTSRVAPDAALDATQNRFALVIWLD